MKEKISRLNGEPQLIPGELSIDDRGELGFVNNFDMSGIKRFYSVRNHKVGFIRAWHAHKNEEKYVTVISGAAIICAVLIDNWENPSKGAKVHRFVLSTNKPSVVFIPKGYANGFVNLERDTKLIFFSTRTVEESKGDDFRYDAYYWNPWQIIER